MAAILQLRKGTDADLSSIGNLSSGELFYNTDKEVIQIGTGNSNVTLSRLGINTGSIEFTGDITLGGNIILGDEIQDNITVSGQFDSDLIPSASATYDLGSDSKKWSEIHAETGYFGNGIVSSSAQIIAEFPDGLISGSSQVTITESQISDLSHYSDSNVKTKLNVEGVISGSSQITITESQISDLSHTDISSLNTYTSSNDTTNTTQNTRLDQLSTETGSISTEQSAQDSRLDQLSTETGSISTEQATQNTRLDQFATETGSISNEQAAQDTRLDQLSTETGSISSEQATQNSRLDSIEAVSGSYLTTSGSVDYTDITSKPTLVSGSSQITYGDVSSIPSNIISASTDSSTVNFTITNGNITADLKGGVISGSSQVTITESQISDLSHTDISSLNSYTSSNDINITNIHSTTSSFESRLDLLSDVSHSHANKSTLDNINQELTTTSDVTFNTASFTGDVIITGDFTVLGSATEISSTELRIEDKLITVASGSADSAAADGAGLEIDGAGKSIKWDHNTTSFVLDAKVSSSVGFKGEGGELTGIDTDQVTEGSNLYYTDDRVKIKLDNDGVVSGSSQVVELLDSLNTYTSSNDTTNLIQDSRLDQLSTETGSISSEQAAQDVRLNQLSTETGSIATEQSIQDSRLDQFATETGSISSEQLIQDSRLNQLSTETGSIETEQAAQDTRLDQLSTETGSISSEQLIQDTRLDQFATETGSISTEQTTQNTRLDQFATETGSISSEQLIQDSRLNQLSSETGSISTEQTIQNSRLDQLSSETGSYLTTVDISTDTNLGVLDTDNVDLILDGDTLSANLKGGVVSGSSFVSNQQGSITASINGTATNIDLGLNTNDSPSFSSLSLNGLVTSSDSVLTALFVDSNEIKFNSLGTAALLHYSNSIDDGNSEVIGTAQAVKNYIDGAIIEAGAGDITEVNAGLGLDGGALTGSATVGLDTGSSHFQEGVEKYTSSTEIPSGTVSGSSQVSYVGLSNIPSGIVSGSSQITITESQISDLSHYTDADVKEKLDEEGVVSGSSQINVTATTNYSSINQYSDSKVKTKLNIESVISSSEQITDFGFISSSDSTTSLNEFTSSIQTEVSGLSAQTSSYLVALPDDLVSGSSQIDVTATTNYSSINQYSDSKVKTKLNGDGVISGSSQIDVTSTTNYSSINQYSDSKVKGKLDSDGVISGSSQINHDATTNFVANEHIDHSTITVGSGKGLDGGGTIDTNRSIFLDTGSVHFQEGVELYSSTLPSGTVSGSSQVDVTATTNYSSINQYSDSKVKTKLNAEGVISGSSQVTITESQISDLSHTDISSLNSYTSSNDLNITKLFSSSSNHEGRIDTLEGDTHENVLTFNDTSTIELDRSTDTITANVIGGIFSGSAQVAAGGDVSGNVDSLTVEKVQGVSLTSGEATQLANIGTSTITSAQWGYLGGTDQQLYTGADVTFNDINASGDVVINGDFTVLGSATEISTTELSIEDKLITVASGSSTPAAADGAGIEVAGANESITWNNGNSRWAITNDVFVSGSIKASDDIIAYASSDKRLKDDIQPIKNPIEKINSISGNSFVWNEERQDIYKGKDYGVIAQEIEEILPELVVTKENGYKAVKYDKLISLLVEGIKELSKEIKELKNK
jgi:hypothetical protein